jgi:hypothetical protein
MEGVNWSLVHTISISDGVSWDANTTDQPFYVGSKVGYTYYRLVINRIQFAPSVSAATFASWKIYGDSYAYSGLSIRGKFDVGSFPDTSTSTPTLTVDPNTSRVGIGSTAPTHLLDVNGGSIRCSALSGANGATLIATANGIITYNFSDAALKTDITPMTTGLAEIRSLNPVNFNWKDVERFGTQRQYGLIAQEVAEIIPGLTGTAPDGYATLDYVKLVPILVKAVQELSVKVAWLETRQLQ